jgi:hypothetical protein
VFAKYKPTGSEFQVNTYTNGAQENSSAAPLANGGFVVTWMSDGQDGSGPGVYGQLFDNSANKVGSEFGVNTYTDHAQGLQSAAGLSGGGFVVTWASYDQDGSDWGVYGQVFGSSGNKVGGEFKVNTYTTANQVSPSAAGLSGGGFVVTWESDGQDLSGSGVYGQVFGSTGNKVGGEFGVNTYTTNDQWSPSAAGLSGGGFVVTWASLGQDPSAPDVYGQVFDSTGKKAGSEFKVNTFTLDGQISPSAAGLSGGGFVVTWASYDQDGSDWGVYGQVFGSTGNKVGNEFKVNTYTRNDQWFHSVAGLSEGGFVVTWGSDGQDGSNYGAYGQVFDSAGNKVGSEFRLNTYTANDQGDTSGAGLSGGGFVVTWHSNGQDGSEWGIYGRRYSFEGGVGRDELVLNFGPAHGLYQYDQTGGYKQWNTVNPSQMVTVDLDGDGTDELVAAFPGDGLYTYDSTNGRQRINTLIPEFMGAGRNNRIACDYGAAYGLWLWDAANGWQRINTADPDKMIAADIDSDGEDELVAGFIGYGLYSYDDPGVWTQINTMIPDAMVRYSNGVVCDYGAAHGLWSYSNSGGWVQFNAADPDKIVAVDLDNDGRDELVVFFVGWGLYTYEPVGGIWQQINTEIPEGMIRQGNGIAVDYGAAYGLWYWDAAGGWVQRNTVDPEQMVAVDIDKDGAEELVVSFSGYGLWYYDETIGWQLLNAVVPDDMKPINFYP